MNWPLVIELAGKPEAWARARLNRATGAIFTPTHVRKYQDALRVAASDAMNGEKPIEGPVALTVIVTVPIPASWSGKKQRAAIAGAIRPVTKPDASNYLKGAEDALNSIVFRDDGQIVDERAIKVYGERPALRYEVSPIILPAVEPLSRVRPGDGMAQLPLEGAAP